MASAFMQMDAANIFVGDDNPTDSLFLSIKNVNFPDLEEGTKEHIGGGAAGVIEMGNRVIRPFNFTFQLEGFNADHIGTFMPSNGARLKYTVRANLRDLRTHADVPVLGVIEGRMTKMTTSEFTRDNGVTTDYEIKEVFFYTLHVGGQEKLYFEYLKGLAGVRKNGQAMFAAPARNLGLI
jgi:phage tail tube protein FII